MSDIAVRKLAEIINAPVEVLLKQLQDAGIAVSGPDARITNAQKLTLLAHIRQGATSTTNHSSSKITLKRRSTSEMTVGAGRGKTVSVEVRRKKTFSKGSEHHGEDDSHAGANVSRTEELTRQLAAERKAREEAIQRAEQERRQLEARRLEQQRQKTDSGKLVVAISESLDTAKPAMEPVVAVVEPPVLAEPSVVLEASVSISKQSETPIKALVTSVELETEATDQATTEGIDAAMQANTSSVTTENVPEVPKAQSEPVIIKASPEASAKQPQASFKS